MQAAAEEPSPKVLAVWSQVFGAVEIEEAQAALAKATGEEAKELQTKLDELQVQYPHAGQAKELFSDQWDLMKYAVAMDKLSRRVHEAEESNACREARHDFNCLLCGRSLVYL